MSNSKVKVTGQKMLIPTERLCLYKYLNEMNEF